MKLEIEITPQNSFNQYQLPKNTSSEETIRLLNDGIQFAKDGNRAEARQSLLRVTETEPENETAWLWLASISEYPEELMIFLRHVLKINPNNERALEWSAATKSLLSKTFIQHGLNALQEERKDFARQCFLQAIVHDSNNETPWLELSSLTDSDEEKIAYLQKVLDINPANDIALSSIASIKQQKSQELLRKANAAAVAGEREEATGFLRELMEINPEVEEGWILKAYLAESSEEKIEFYEKALELNPDNEAAQAGLISLQAILQKTSEQKPFAEALKEAFEANNLSEIESAHENLPEYSLEDESDDEEFSADVQIVEVQSAEIQSAEVQSTEAQNEDNQPSAFEASSVNRESSLSNEEDFSMISADNPTQDLDENFVKEAEAAMISSVEAENDGPEENYQAASEDYDDEEASSEAENLSPVYFEAPVNLEEDEENESFSHELSEPAIPFVETQAAEEKPGEVNLKEEDSGKEAADSDYSFQGYDVVDENPVNSQHSENLYYSNEKLPADNAPFSVEAYSAENYPGENYFSEPAPVESDVIELFADEPDEQVEVEYLSPDESPELSESVFAAGEFSPVENEPVNSFEEETLSAEESEPVILPPEEKNFASSAPKQSGEHCFCPFCNEKNEPLSIICSCCKAMLSLADLESLLAYQDANLEIIEKVIELLEDERSHREFNVDELTDLATAHLNAKHLRTGLDCLREAGKLNPNDIGLSSKINFLAVRLAEIEDQRRKAAENEIRKCTIMIVDDSATVRKLVSGKLEKCGHTVISAANGPDALVKINEIKPDLILLDIAMPEMDGYQVCQIIRSNEMTKDVPVLMISGKDGSFDIGRGRKVGSTGFITKPFGPETLMRTLETYIT